MSIARCRHLAFLIVCGTLTAIPPAHGSAAVVPQESAQAQPSQIETSPQIVRIRHVEGDVRISRGNKSAVWETAVADLPLETGFNLVTGAGGRAEIEFEDASTVYLDENSALAFNQLETTGGIPHTALGLLTGTATLHLHLRTPGETFFLRTPSDGISVRYPGRIYERVSSYLDAMSVTQLKHAAVTPQTSPTAGAGERPVRLETAIYNNEAHGTVEKPGNSVAFADWDSWVEGRIASRSAAMAAVMKASGLTTPLPGLADMNSQGTFFPCAPYGTCWEPADRTAMEPDSALHDEAQQRSAPAPQQTAPMTQIAAPQPIEHFERDAFFPCPPTTIRSMIARDPVTGHETLLASSFEPFGPYDWAVCHAGSWIYRRHRYAWVVGTRRHHRCPVRWIKTGRSVAYVPIHPRDEKGKPPINREHGVFAIHGKQSVERITLGAGSNIKLLNTPPKEFRSISSPALSRAGDPHVNAYRLAGTMVAAKSSGIRELGTTLTFDHKSQSFMVAKQVMQANKNAPELRAFNSRIRNTQTHAGSARGFGGSGSHSSNSGGSRGGTSGGGSHGSGGGGGFHGGGSSGGGGFHGGSSGGGGGSHGGGGGGGAGGGGGHH
jgi:FecR protein